MPMVRDAHGRGAHGRDAHDRGILPGQKYLSDSNSPTLRISGRGTSALVVRRMRAPLFHVADSLTSSKSRSASSTSVGFVEQDDVTVGNLVVGRLAIEQIQAVVFSIHHGDNGVESGHIPQFGYPKRLRRWAGGRPTPWFPPPGNQSCPDVPALCRPHPSGRY